MKAELQQIRAWAQSKIDAGEVREFVTSTGVKFDKTGMADFITQRIKRAGLGLTVWTAHHPEGWKEYVVLNGNQPVYANQSAEAVAIWADCARIVPEMVRDT